MSSCFHMISSFAYESPLSSYMLIHALFYFGLSFSFWQNLRKLLTSVTAHALLMWLSSAFVDLSSLVIACVYNLAGRSSSLGAESIFSCYSFYITQFNNLPIVEIFTCGALLDNSTRHIISQWNTVGTLDMIDLCFVGLWPLYCHIARFVTSLALILNANNPWSHLAIPDTT